MANETHFSQLAEVEQFFHCENGGCKGRKCIPFKRELTTSTGRAATQYGLILRAWSPFWEDWRTVNFALARDFKVSVEKFFPQTFDLLDSEEADEIVGDIVCVVYYYDFQR